MKFLIFKNNPVNVNVCFLPLGKPTEFDEEIDLNYKHISPDVITVESPKPFYYAVDTDKGRGWRAINLEYITNSKVKITLLSQYLNAFDNGVFAGTGSINIKPQNFSDNSEFNILAGSPSSLLTSEFGSHRLIHKYLIDDWKPFCIFQTTTPLYEGAGSHPIVSGWKSNEFAPKLDPQDCDYSRIDKQTKATLGVYTYFIKMDGGAGYYDDFLFGLISERTDFVNARMVYLPEDFFDDSLNQYIEIDNDIETITLKMYVMKIYEPHEVIVDSLSSDSLLYGDNCWKVGSTYIYPNVDETGFATLKFVLIIGVGTCFGLFYTGEFKNLMTNPQSSVVFEMGYNFAPNTINPSLYYSNKQYQGMVKAIPILQGASGMASTIANIALMPSVVTKVATGVGSAVNTTGSILKSVQQVEREKFNRSTVNNVNDVQDLGDYFTNSLQVVRLCVELDNPQTLRAIIDNYTPHSVLSYEDCDVDNMPKVVKYRSMENETNTKLYRDGFLFVDIDSLYSVLTGCS